MKKHFISALLGLFCISNISTVFATESDLATTIATRFAKIWSIAPQEKLYLHTDKPYLYSAGEDIWFRAHLVSAATHEPNTKSQFVYVELIDQSDSVITRVKLQRDPLGAAGKIAIAPEMAPGEYMIRAYTYWMQNATPDFFFHKKIYIGNFIDDRVQIKYKFGSVEDEKISLTITFTNTFSKPLAGKTVAIKQNWTRKNRKISNFVTNQQGDIFVLLNADSTTNIKKILEVSLNEPGIKFNRKIEVPDNSQNYDVQFFPESGSFLDDNFQTIAYKAIGTDGLSIDISGKLFNQNNEEISEFHSFNKGMGKLVLRTFPGESYYARVVNKSGIEKVVPLPPTSSAGVGLKITTIRGKIYFQVHNQTALPTESLFLMIHSRGIAYLVAPLTKSEGQLPEGFLPSGISTFTIIDSLGNTYCERLSFIRNFNFSTITMAGDKNKYGKRELVNLSFNIANLDSLPATGSFSVSVTDSYHVQSDSINDDILSYLLLSSDIQGYIEEPQQYFYDNSMLTQEKTDLLMLTQGWRRFSTAEITKGVYPQPQFYMEAGQSVSGKVYNLFNKPVNNSEIIFFSNYKNQISTTKTDSTGLFIIEGIDFPDSTQIILKAKSKTKIVDVELVPDPDVFPDSKHNRPFTTEKSIPLQDDYFLLSKEKYYTDGGMLVINLDEFTVNAETKKSSEDHFYSGMADNTIDASQLETYGNMNVLDLIRTFPGVMVSGDAVSVRGSSGNPLFLIDGIETEEVEDVKYLNSTDIEDISLFKGASASLFGSRGGNGVIAITLKKGAILQSITPASLAHITPLGYQKPADFYVPKYEVDSILNQTKPDLRTTIYWAPKVQPDDSGNIQLQFYTADKSNDYRVELEGVTNEGEICRFRGTLKRN